jgi:hypothetical protein
MRQSVGCVCVLNKRRVNYDARKTLLGRRNVGFVMCDYFLSVCARGENSLASRVSCAGRGKMFALNISGVNVLC